jgi:thiol:disulfide interchange protein DsbD
MISFVFWLYKLDIILMKNFLKVILVFFLFIPVVKAQIIESPVKWNTTVEKMAEDEYNLIVNAIIKEGWHLYSQNVPEFGPIPTSFSFNEKASDFQLLGKTIESEGIEAFDTAFDMKIKYFEKEAVFKQKIKTLKALKELKATVSFMVCDDERCLPPEEVTIKFNLSGQNTSLTSASKQNTGDILPNEISNKMLYGVSAKEITKSSINCSNQLTESSVIEKSNTSLWNIFGLGFIGGLLALLTPCVFPMIPLTVSFFTKQSKNKIQGIKNAVLYGLSIIVIYVLLGTVTVALFGASSINELSTSVTFNVIFFLILLFFAFSFFGFYELTLPSTWSTKVDEKSDKGGIVGIFFMALALAIVSFSCTGPLVGSLLVKSASEGGLSPLFGMLGFSSAIALPFALFAAFPGWLNSLPKSGGWLNSVKVILGFLELALAFKFLSNADLVAHWNLLKIEPFLGIWIAIGIVFALYLFGKIKFPHDSPLQKLSFLRISGGILVVAFVVYLSSGFRVDEKTNTFTPLTLLSGLAPPVGYSFLYPNDCPNNLNCFKDLQTGINYAKSVNKPILLDFTGYACVNCRKMEEHVWPLPEVDQLIRNEYVLISLYVDDKKELPKEEQIAVKRANGEVRTLKTYGHKWAHYQTQFFQTNSQPYYALVNSDATQILNNPVGYTPNEKDYTTFLNCGLEVFKK